MDDDSSFDAASLPSICTDCGLCCNGALFDQVPVAGDERSELLALGFTLRPAGESEVFDQPCQMLTGRLCSVYLQRPHTCRKFRCLLLRAYNDGEVSRDQALERIDSAKALLAEVAGLLAPGETIKSARFKWKQWSTTGGGLAGRSESRLMLHMTMLNRFLDRYFRREHQRTMVPADAEEKPPHDA